MEACKVQIRNYKKYTEMEWDEMVATAMATIEANGGTEATTIEIERVLVAPDGEYIGEIYEYIGATGETIYKAKHGYNIRQAIGRGIARGHYTYRRA